LVADRAVAETTPEELARLIVGESTEGLSELAASAPEQALTSSNKPILTIERVTVRDDRGHDALQRVSLAVCPGEVVGVAGVDGNGQRELIQAILGLARPVEGDLTFEGHDLRRVETGKRLKMGLRLIPEDRHSEGVIESWNLEANAALGLQRLEPLAHGPYVDAGQRHILAERVVNRFKTKHGGLGLPMASLSGGNQQRLVTARALELGPKLLVAFQPARGLDLGGTANVYRAIREECGKGMAALVVSFDLDELLLHCDRIVVLNHGALSEPPAHLARDREAIGRLMVGAA
jgi:ABC-type uncharacterized transport system ATPase subunit